MNKTPLAIWKLFIAALLICFAFSSASAICTKATENYYYDNGTAIDCSKSPALPSVMYSQVIPMSLPLHFTFGVYKTIDVITPAVSALGCDSALYGPVLNKIVCTTDKNVYETHNATRYKYGFSVSYDTVVIASKTNEPIPVLIGRDMIVNSGTNPFSAVCKGDNLCYTQVPLS